METTYKTKTVSEQLGVNPTTIQRWVKYFNIPCHRNEHGHYLFKDSDILLLKNIKEQLNRGLSMAEVQIEQHNNKKETRPRTLKKEEMIEKFNELSTRMNDIERRLEEKADEVVAYQLLQHRSEIDDLLHKLTKLEHQIEQLQEKQQKESTIAFHRNDQKGTKKRRLASLLSIASE